MSFFNRLPRWEAVVQQAGVGQDPFRYLMNSVEQIAYPKTPNSVFGILLGFAGVYLIAILVCFSLLLIPVVQGPEARKRHFWLYKKQHLPGSSTPYFIFNSGLVMILSQLVASLLFETYIFLTFNSLKSPALARKTYIYVWLEICWLPGYIGFHVTAFGSLYTYSRFRFFIRPSFLNTMFFGIPILVTLQTLGWCTALFLNARAQNKSYLDFQNVGLEGSKVWKSTSKVDSGMVSETLSHLTTYLTLCDQYIGIARWSSCCWAIIGFGLAIFYAMAVAALVRLLKSCMALAKGKRSFFTRTLEYRVDAAGFSTVGTTLDSIHLTPQPGAKRLQTGYVYLIGHCSVMVLCLLLDASIGTLMAVQTERAVTDPKWRALGNWITLVGSCFVSVAMLLQSWRILTERDTTQLRNTTIEKPIQEEEVTPARFIVEEESYQGDDEPFQNIEKVVDLIQSNPKHASFTRELSLQVEIEGSQV